MDKSILDGAFAQIGAWFGSQTGQVLFCQHSFEAVLEIWRLLGLYWTEPLEDTLGRLDRVVGAANVLDDYVGGVGVFLR